MKSLTEYLWFTTKKRLEGDGAIIRGLISIGTAILLAASAACGGDDNGGSTRTVPQEVIESINAYIDTGSVEADGIAPDRTLVQPEACLNPGDLCVFLGNTEISGDDATVGVATHTSDASWAFTLTREDGAWKVAGFEYTGG